VIPDHPGADARADPGPGYGPDLGSDLADLAGRLREAGIGVDAARVGFALAAVAELGPVDRHSLYWGTRLTLCASPADLVAFEAAFAAWLAGRRQPEPAGPGHPGEPAGLPAPSPVPPSVAASSAVAPSPVEPATGGLRGTGVPADPADPAMPAGSGTEEGNTAGDGTGAEGTWLPGLRAVPTEVLARRDLRTLTDAERAEILALIARLARTRPDHPSRRHRPGGRRRLDPAGTLRTMLRDGGEPAHPRYRRRKVRPRRLTLLVDVSESMTGYREALLRFAHAALVAAPTTTEVFTLGTRCTRVTRALAVRDPRRAMAALAEVEPYQGGGTRLGRCLREFLRAYGGDRRVRSATVVIASDGHDSGPAALLAGQVERLSRLAYRLIWVNPQQGWPGFRPMAPGLVASLRYVDDALPGHSFAALRDLAEVMRR
jgi:uncharacterized protein with von Willebrand factor type A (vWA) domain